MRSIPPMIVDEIREFDRATGSRWIKSIAAARARRLRLTCPAHRGALIPESTYAPAIRYISPRPERLSPANALARSDLTARAAAADLALSLMPGPYPAPA